MDAMVKGATMWVFKDKEMTRVHPRRKGLACEGLGKDEKGIGDVTFVENI